MSGVKLVYLVYSFLGCHLEFIPDKGEYLGLNESCQTEIPETQ